MNEIKELQRELATAKASVQELQDMLQKSADTFTDAANAFRLFGKPTAAEAMTVAINAIDETLAKHADGRARS